MADLDNIWHADATPNYSVRDVKLLNFKKITTRQRTAAIMKI